jgi:hypothetical protein
LKKMKLAEFVEDDESWLQRWGEDQNSNSLH